jgi:hypothetical protein
MLPGTHYIQAQTQQKLIHSRKRSQAMFDMIVTTESKMEERADALAKRLAIQLKVQPEAPREPISSQSQQS